MNIKPPLPRRDSYQNCQAGYYGFSSASCVLEPLAPRTLLTPRLFAARLTRALIVLTSWDVYFSAAGLADVA
jgi:hypothetical protein